MRYRSQTHTPTHTHHSVLIFIFTSFMFISLFDMVCVGIVCMCVDVDMHVEGSKYRSMIYFPLILVYSRCHLFMQNSMVAFTNTHTRAHSAGVRKYASRALIGNVRRMKRNKVDENFSAPWGAYQTCIPFNL